MADASGAVCVMDLCSFLQWKEAKGLPLLQGWAVLVRADADVAAGRAWAQGKGWRKGCLGGSWMACAECCDTERAPSP